MAHSLISSSASFEQSTNFGYSPLALAPEKLENYDQKIPTLAALWARKYVNALNTYDEVRALKANENLVASSREGRDNTARKLLQNLTLASAKAWSQTEALLSTEVQRHQIDPELIDPWQIAADSHQLFEKALQAYADCVTPQRLSVLVSADFGQVRQKYTTQDPRVLGFVSMQFHNTGKTLLESLGSMERSLLNPYLKVMDDHLYMPLRDTYAVAAQHDYHSSELTAVQHLLPVSTAIAQAVCAQVGRQYLGYKSYSGPLFNSGVRISSVRDVEMFQVYLCLCVLENSIRSVQQELFPLCVMLYPRLGVGWQLVRDMLQTMGWEMHDRLTPEDLAVFTPYLRILTEMFSAEVFQGLGMA